MISKQLTLNLSYMLDNKIDYEINSAINKIRTEDSKNIVFYSYLQKDMNISGNNNTKIDDIMLDIFNINCTNFKKYMLGNNALKEGGVSIMLNSLPDLVKVIMRDVNNILVAYNEVDGWHLMFNPINLIYIKEFGRNATNFVYHNDECNKCFDMFNGNYTF